MRRLSMILAAAIGFLMGSEGMPAAGVVMSETSSVNGPIANQAEHRTIYVQGNKQKIDMDGVATITDLDKRQLFIVDKQHRNYIEVPLNLLSERIPDSEEPETAEIVLKRTGRTHVVADQRCDEYRGRKGDDKIKIAVSACVSKDARGAQEITRFDNEMISHLRGSKIKTDQEAGAIVLQKESVVNFRVPDPSRHGYRTASLVTKARVNDIRLRQLPAQTFTPPKGYARVEDEPALNAPDAAQWIALMQTHSQIGAFAFGAHSES